MFLETVISEMEIINLPTDSVDVCAYSYVADVGMYFSRGVLKGLKN